MSEGTAYKLIVVIGPRKGQSFVLQAEDQIIGRGEGCAIRFAEDPLISREHMRLHVADGELMAEDLGSTHGSLLNGKALRGGASVVVGDQLQVGGLTLKVEAAVSGEQNSEAPQVEVPAGEAIDETSSTSHLHPDDSPKTQVHVGFGAAASAGDDEDGDVLSYEGQQTRMLKPEELAGLRSAAAKPKRSVSKSPVMGILIVALLVGGIFTYFKMQKDDEGKVILSTSREVRDEQFRMAVNVPYAWQRVDSALPLIAEFKVVTPEGQEAGEFLWHATRERSFETTGLNKGFEQLEAEIAARHPGYERLKIQRSRFNSINVIEYQFTADHSRGRGVYFFQKDARMWVEGSATTLMYPQLAEAILTAVRSVDLDEAHVYSKYDEPTLEVKRRALQDPDSVVAEAAYLFRQAKELITRRSMRPENLYRSIMLLKTCLQNCEALTSYPDFRDEAARKLVEARHLYTQEVKRQRALVKGAVKIKDYKTARIECYHLMQMAPDKTSKTYKDADKLFKKLQNLK